MSSGLSIKCELGGQELNTAGAQGDAHTFPYSKTGFSSGGQSRVANYNTYLS